MTTNSSDLLAARAALATERIQSALADLPRQVARIDVVGVVEDFVRDRPAWALGGVFLATTLLTASRSRGRSESDPSSEGTTEPRSANLQQAQRAPSFSASMWAPLLSVAANHFLEPSIRDVSNRIRPHGDGSQPDLDLTGSPVP